MRRPVLPTWPASAPRCGAVRLRAVTDDDVEMARELSTDPYVPLVGSLPARASVAEAKTWIERQRERFRSGTAYTFTITDVADGRPVGHCSLTVRELAAGRASAGYAIAPSCRGRGLAADALGALTSFAWSLPGLDRVELLIEPWNTASVRTAERAGYSREGLLRRYQEIAGERRDMLLYAALAPRDRAP